MELKMWGRHATSWALIWALSKGSIGFGPWRPVEEKEREMVVVQWGSCIFLLPLRQRRHRVERTRLLRRRNDIHSQGLNRIIWFCWTKWLIYGWVYLFDRRNFLGILSFGHTRRRWSRKSLREGTVWLSWPLAVESHCGKAHFAFFLFLFGCPENYFAFFLTLSLSLLTFYVCYC